MSLSGSGVIAIWNDITDEGRANFYEWHDREHIPERVAIPGFLRGRRYIALWERRNISPFTKCKTSPCSPVRTIWRD